MAASPPANAGRAVVAKAQIILLPVYQRHWVFSCREQQIQSSVAWEVTAGGGGLRSSVAQAWSAFGQRVRESAARQWHSASLARRGSVANYSYRFGQWAMSLAHHDETFLNSVPSGAMEMELVFPASLRERYVRRRLRLLIRGRMEYHRRWAMIWGALTIPQMPLLITPLPNLPIYFSIYRTWSHYRAWKGAGSLNHIIVDIDCSQLQRMRAALLEMEAAGRSFPEGSWPLDLIRMAPRYGDKLQPPKPGVVAHFTESHLLEDIVQPGQLWKSPISDTQVEAAAEAFSFPTREVLAHVSRARAEALKECGNGGPSRKG